MSSKRTSSTPAEKPSPAGLDTFARIAMEGGPRLREGLTQPAPPPRPKRLLSHSADAADQPFPPQKKLASAEDLKQALAQCRRHHAPFLEDHAPPIPSCRKTQRLATAQWRLETSQDRANFIDTLSGAGAWETVRLPHYGPPVGRHTAYYRTTFTLDSADIDRRAVFVRFNGVDYRASVFVNGYLLGSHEGFFAPFEFDATHCVQPGENVLLIRVENDWHDHRGEKLYAATGLGWDDPETGWHHCPPGMGIYQDVLVESRPRLHVHDLFVRPLPEHNQAEAWIEVRNCSDESHFVDMDLSVFGQNFQATIVEHLRHRPTTHRKNGMGDTYSDALQKAAGTPDELRLPMDPGINYLRVTIPLDDVRAWSPRTPWLYQLQARLVNESGELLDAACRQFGMRSFVQDTTQSPRGGFYLNGEFTRLRGANTMGHEQQCVFHGDMDQLIDDILLAKLCNMNFWRLTQRPVQPEVYDYCDRLGLMTQTDLPLFGHLQIGQFAEAARQAGDMERLIRSHACNILVSYINEPMPNAQNRPNRYLSREQLESFFEAATHQVHLWNPDRVVKPVDGDYDPPGVGTPDNHCYPGWYNGHGIDIGRLHRGYWQPVKEDWYYGCGEFGAEGLDPLEIMQTYYPADWLPADERKEADWSPSQIVMAQSGRFHHFFYETPHRLADWIAASQQHQACATRMMTEAFRRDERMNTFAIHLFIDAFPAGWMKTIMDVNRQPKQAFFAYRDALRPLMPSLRSDRLAFFSCEPAEIEAWICNDLPQRFDDLALAWQLEMDGEVLAGGRDAVTIEPSRPQCHGLLRFTAPSVSARSQARVRLALLEPAGNVLQDTTLELAIFPEPVSLEPATVYILGDADTPAATAIEETGGCLQPAGSPQTGDVVLVAGAETLQRYGSRVFNLARKGARVVIDELPPGVHQLGPLSIRVKPSIVGPLHFASRNTGHPIVAGFQPDDVRLWHDPDADMIAPFLNSSFTTNHVDVQPILLTGNVDDSGEWGPAMAAASMRVGRGVVIINQIQLGRRVRTNPIARLYAQRLFTRSGDEGEMPYVTETGVTGTLL